jgi:hypothetical protein
MPLDPAISLGAADPLKAQAARPGFNTMSPLETMSTFADIQNKLNTNKLFQQTYAAKLKAGQLIAAAPTLEDGLDALTRDPQTAPFAPEIINTFRQTQLTLAQTQEINQGMAANGLQGFVKMLPAVLADPSDSTWAGAQEAALAGLAPEARKRVQSSIDSIKKSLLAGLPTDDPEAAGRMFSQRLNGLLTGAGMTPELLSGILGKVDQVDTGGGLQPGVRGTALDGGGFNTNGNSLIPKTLPPEILDTGDTQGAVGGAYPTPTVGNPLFKGLPPGAYAPGTVPAGGKYGTGGAGAQVEAPAYDPNAVAATGKPLFPPEMTEKSPTVGNATGIGGVAIKSPAQTRNAEALAARFADEGTRQFQGAQDTMRAMEYTIAALDKLGAERNFLSPGTAGEFRVNFAKGLNTLFASFGVKELFDLDKIAAGEGLKKETIRGGFSAMAAAMGVSREAATVVQNSIDTIPSLENTYMGGRLISEEIQAIAERQIDRYNFMSGWQAQNQGDLQGAEAAFNKYHPVEDYTNPVLSHYGMNPDGKGFLDPQGLGKTVLADPTLWFQTFPSIESLRGAIATKTLTDEQAAAIAASLDAAGMYR